MNQYFINNQNLENNEKINNVIIKNINIKFLTDNGLFHKNGLDYGTRLLLENFDFKNKKTFLDVGCGCGPIGIYLAKLSENYEVDMFDINEHAIELCKKSIKLNNLKNIKIFLSNGFDKVNKKYDAILINPPIHAGKKVIYELIKNSKNYLDTNGELWIVIRKNHGAKSLINDMKDIYESKIIKKNNGFYVIKMI